MLVVDNRNNGEEDHQERSKGQGFLEGMANTVLFSNTVKGG